MIIYKYICSSILIDRLLLANSCDTKHCKHYHTHTVLQAMKTAFKQIAFNRAFKNQIIHTLALQTFLTILIEGNGIFMQWPPTYLI